MRQPSDLLRHEVDVRQKTLGRELENTGGDRLVPLLKLVAVLAVAALILVSWRWLALSQRSSLALHSGLCQARSSIATTLGHLEGHSTNSGQQLEFELAAAYLDGTAAILSPLAHLDAKSNIDYEKFSLNLEYFADELRRENLVAKEQYLNEFVDLLAKLRDALPQNPQAPFQRHVLELLVEDLYSLTARYNSEQN